MPAPPKIVVRKAVTKKPAAKPAAGAASKPPIRSHVLHADGLARCPWPGEDPLYVAYHDTEWGVPEWDSRALFEKLILDGFQAGLSWITILRKRDAFRRGFDGFLPEKIARYRPVKIEKLMQDAGIVRNRSKIESTVKSAQVWLDIESKQGFSNYLWDFFDGAPLQGQRRHMGDIPDRDGALAKNLERSEVARFQFLRPDHRLCLRAGGRHGQRSSRWLPLPRRLWRAGEAARPRNLMPTRAAPAPRAFQRMLSGRRLDLLDPSPLDVEIEDIAHGLARVARWNGQTTGAHIFSVAQHSLLVERIAGDLDPGMPARWRMMTLLHDAPEYVIGDMISPFKAVIGEDYKGVENRILAAIHLRFALPATHPAALARLVKQADRAAAFIEATRLAGFSFAEAEQFFARPKIAARNIDTLVEPMDATAAKNAFMNRFAAIEADMNAGAGE